ncbi:phosphatase PAP2 family protein [Actinomycetospora sp. CA-053990]|uniref:phosphatase PAP2 family protein n=1 Tax=Actinomycetospora sp. CA-053990 TaxID=3239891 RepID=UPI003D8C0E8A
MTLSRTSEPADPVPPVRPVPAASPVLIAVVVTLVALGAFLALWATLVSTPFLAAFDTAVVTEIAAHRPAGLTAVMVVVTDLGSPTAMITLLVVVALVLGLRRRSWHPVSFGLGGLAAVLVVDVGMKLVVVRPRPPLELRAVAASGFSFPSGHALVSAGVLLLIAHLVLAHHHRHLVAATLGGGLAIVAVGVSRVVLGVHYPSDVLAGWCLAVVAVGAVVVVDLVVARRRDGLSGEVPRRPFDGS